ncbi:MULTISPECIES: hypothetical protein [unclassified Microcoleus]|jgi:hypothetical protein|uniref:hypothetical protein n=1 Tax=unclassified Microcoleus TaxID=2642155 RepID=UPI002FD16D33
MTNPTASEIVFKHIWTNPAIFLEVLNNAAPEQREAVLTYLQTLPEVDHQQTNPSEEANDDDR